ncbi:MAG: hypothetical protein EAZ97_15950 [Bacteroidetes bacterium]|nr:MAG: hypothetical protein EAZ97_15950 [Bacteroidota bacterium]
MLEYDGVSWRAIPNEKPAIPYDLAIDKNGKIYVATIDDFGYLKADKKGNTAYQSLKQALKDTTYKIGNVWAVKLNQDFAYLLTSDAILEYAPKTEKLSIFKADTNGRFVGNFVYKNTYYVRLAKKGLMKIENSELKPALQSEFFKDKNPFRIAIPFDEKTILIPTRTEGLYLYQPEKDSVPQSFEISNKDFLFENNIYNAYLFQKDNFVLSSLSKGAVLSDKQGNILQEYKESNLLQNNTIYEISTDSNKNLWFGLAIGISKAEHGLDLTYWDKKAGLKGSVYQIIRFNKRIYIATSTKVYFIDQNNQIQEVKNVPAGQNWSFLEFKNPSAENMLLVGTAHGIYEIKEDQAIEIYKGTSHAHKLLQSSKNPSRIFSTDFPNFISLRYENKKWIFEGKWENIKDEIRGMIEDENGELWLGTFKEGVIRITPNNDSIHKPTKIQYYNQKQGFASLLDILPFNFQNKIIWCTEKGLYIHNPKTDRFEPFCELGRQFCDGSRSVFSLQKMPDGKIWISPLKNKNTDIGFLQNNKGVYDWTYAPFRRIPEMAISSFYIEESGIMWVGGSEGVYRYDPTKDIKNYKQNFNCLIRKVIVGTDSVLYAGNATEILSKLKNDLDYELNTVKFEFAAPFFDSEERTLYSYQLEGFDEKWSEWGRHIEKEYTNLWEGTYTFKVRAKNIYEVESEIGTYQIRILPPYYRSIWAYALYLILIVLSIFEIVRLNTRRLLRDKKRLEGIVEARTAEVVKQKDEILLQNTTLEHQKEEIQAQAEELKTTNQKLVELDNFKEGMTGMIVHDLKNPLGSILASNDLERVKQSGKQMLNMVMNILDVQKFEDAKMVLDLQNHSAYNLVQNAHDQVALLIKEKNISFENQIDPQIGIQTESEILERVFVNLLTNAIKYTPNNGKITINQELGFINDELNTQKLISNSSFLMLKVSDSGQGIPADKLDLVFEKFGQVKATNSGGIRSTGLGLTFCKMAIEAHGGQIGVESELGEGTTFWFTVPKGLQLEITKQIETKQIETEIVGLTDSDKQIVLPLLAELRALEIYEVSDIRNLLKNIDSSNNPNLVHWLDEMKNALRSSNEEKYVELLNLIEN